MPFSSSYHPDPRFPSLGEGFFDPVDPARFPQHAAGPAKAAYEGAQFEALRKAIDLFTPSAPERLEHAYFQGEAPCSLLIDEIEAIWSAIAEGDDWSRFEAKVAAVRAMGALYGNAPG